MSEAGQFVRRTLVSSAIILVIICIIAFAAAYKNSVFSIAVGWLISAASFTILAIVVIQSFAENTKAAFIALVGIIKMCLLGLVLWWLVSHGFVEPLSLLAGFSTVVIALLVEGVGVSR